MTNQKSVRVRMVRCPKCSMLLVELPEFTLYECGGCGTSLQAKNWKPEAHHSESAGSGSGSPQINVSNNEISSSNNSTDDPPQLNSFLDKENERFEDDGDIRSVDEFCLDTSAPSSHSCSPEVESHSNKDSPESLKEESKNSPLGQSEDSGIKTDDEVSSISNQRDDSNETRHHVLSGDDEEKRNSLTEVGLVNRDLGFVPSPGNFSHEGDDVSRSSATRDSEADDDDGEGGNVNCLQIGSSSPQRTMNENGVDSSRSSPILESHVSLYMTSPDVDHLDHSPAVGRFSSSDNTLGNSPSGNTDYDINVRYFTNYASGSYHAYYGSESSYDGNEYLNFPHVSRGNRKNKHPEDYISGNMMRLNTDPVVSKSPLTSSDPELVHRLRNPSSFTRNSLPPRPSSRPLHDPLSCSEPTKMDLLRTVNELKDQLKKMQIPKNTVFPPSGVQEKYRTSFNYNHLGREDDFYQELNHSDTYHPRCELFRDHTRCSCLRCYPHSAQIPSHFLHHCKNGCCTLQTGHSCCNISSSSSSPHHYYMDSTHSSQGCDKMCDDMKNQDREMKSLLSKEKQKTPKKHLLPLAGGAPFVNCYYCSELLQLPADFVIFNKRCHRLMCGACKKVLIFSILGGTKIVRYLPNASTTPPPSETGESSNVRTLSRSDDNDRSFARRDYSGREEVKSDSRKISSDRKMKSVVRDSRDDKEEPVEVVGSSSKVVNWRKTTSDIEERGKLSNSPLHRLMGYSSPGRVLNS